MNKRYIFAGILLTAALLLNGCGNSGKQPAATLSVPSETVTETTATTASTAETTSSAAASAVTTAVTKPFTTAAATTASAVTTATEPPASEHWIEVAQSLFSRTVPEQYRDYDLTEEARKALEDGTEIMGILRNVCIDEENNNVYVCIYYGQNYGFGGEELSVKKGYSFYRIDGDTAAVTELANDDDSPLRNMQTMFRLGGRLLISSYHGFYAVDEENGGLIIVDEENEPICGGASVSGDKVYMTTVLKRETSSPEEHYREYDPVTNTLREITLEETKAIPKDMNVSEYAYERSKDCRVTKKEDEDGNLIYRIEWGAVSAE